MVKFSSQLQVNARRALRSIRPMFPAGTQTPHLPEAKVERGEERVLSSTIADVFPVWSNDTSLYPSRYRTRLIKNAFRPAYLPCPAL